MTFAEFNKWCNNRCCDGNWGMYEAMCCIAMCSEVLKQRALFGAKRKREKYWQSHPDRPLVEQIVHETNLKIEEKKHENNRA